MQDKCNVLIFITKIKRTHCLVIYLFIPVDAMTFVQTERATSLAMYYFNCFTHVLQQHLSIF